MTKASSLCIAFIHNKGWILLIIYCFFLAVGLSPLSLSYWYCCYYWYFCYWNTNANATGIISISIGIIGVLLGVIPTIFIIVIIIFIIFLLVISIIFISQLYLDIISRVCLKTSWISSSAFPFFSLLSSSLAFSPSLPFHPPLCPSMLVTWWGRLGEEEEGGGDVGICGRYVDVIRVEKKCVCLFVFLVCICVIYVFLCLFFSRLSYDCSPLRDDIACVTSRLLECITSGNDSWKHRACAFLCFSSLPVTWF